MYATAGLDEYSVASTLTTLQELQQYVKRSGKAKDCGPGKCFWADEFALRTVSEGLQVTILIIDDQATRVGRGGGGGGSTGMSRKRRRRNDNEKGSGASSPPSKEMDNRFVFIGNYPRGVILHRSRRQHYNAVVVDGLPVIGMEQLPLSVRSLWPIERSPDQSEAEKAEYPSKVSSGSNNLNEKGLINECRSKESEKETTSLGQGDDSNQNSKSTNDIEGNGSSSQLIDGAMSSSLVSTSAQQTTLGQFYCGCAGFSSSSWVENFYPKKLVGQNSDRQLDHYQQHFRTVEINSTFYGIPTDSTVHKWKKLFAKSFRVVMKAPKGVTHEKSHLDCSVLSTFMARMRPLHEYLSCILIQCPRSLAVTASHLEQIKQMLEDGEEASWYKGHIALEFRNEATYHDEEVRGFLNRNNTNFTLVMHPNSLGRSTVGTSKSGRGSCSLFEYEPESLSKAASKTMACCSTLVYVRLHGCNDEHRGEYTVEQLKDIANQIHIWRMQGRDVFCFFLNDLEPATTPPYSSPQKKSVGRPYERWCAMPKNAKQLESFVYGISEEIIPDAPKKPKSTLLNFFGKK
eukprot:CAMPEP_0183713802 /NCGR_PEP_ID=MMETSP0737-20130205/8544_1 /TAXON_ID=385413 /ORGANISM="Thalassiosira miniscula, Strain CCMP1093" /LENGTH=571 /DNA_ID=CAMNT_0025942645 /DNA_START=536 /DNA_END=2251 /DNA_ORIENTATION=-